MSNSNAKLQDIREDLARAWLLSNKEPQTALDICERMLQRSLECNFNFGVAECRRVMGYSHTNLREYDAALDQFDVARELFSQIDEVQGLASVYNGIGLVYRTRGAYQKALEMYLAGFRLHKQLDRLSDQSAMVNSIGNIHYSLGDFDQALTYYEMGLEIDRRLDNPYDIAISLNNIGLVHHGAGKYEKAIQYHDKCLAIRRELGVESAIAISLNNIGTSLIELKRYDEAQKLFEESLMLRRALNDEFGELTTLSFLGRLYNYRGNPTQALPTLQQALHMACSHKLEREQFEIHKLLAEAYKQAGVYADALRHHETFAEIKERVLGEQSRGELQRLMVEHQLERAEHEKEVYRLENKQMQLLMEKNAQELTAMALSLIQRNELLQSLERKLESAAAASGKKNRKMLEELIRHMQTNAVTDEQWQLFNAQLTSMQRNFSYALSNIHAGLTATEIKICALLRLKLTTKEIASLLNASPRSIEKHRYNIRKKLNIQASQDLVTMLIDLDWQQARNEADEDSAFTHKLRTTYPKLTEGERKICALLRLNLSTKDIAQILSVAQRTVENHRLRIRKKLALQPGEQLFAFLARL